MPILTIRHVTTYRYRRPVAFGEHRMMLRPRDDEDQKVLEAAIRITPEPADLMWTQDIFGNHVAVAKFAARAAELRFESTIRLDHAPAELSGADVADFARVTPFTYPAHDTADLASCVEPLCDDPRLLRWARAFLRPDGSADTRALVVDMTATIKRTFTHAARHEKGVQDPVRTLELARGSCRDMAVLMIAALRSLGIAARFVSGYLHLADDDEDDVAGGNTHAWVQVYLPGPGWVDCDPSSGRIGNRDLVRVAVVHEPRQAIPLQGSWIGKRSDHLGMKVAVKVTANGHASRPSLRSMAS
jgi:transglutaminase-like putative cysteine protease